MNENFEDNLFDRKVIDNREISMIESLKYLLSQEENKTLDIAVGYFYLSGLQLLKDEIFDFINKRNGKIRVIMGNQTSKQTADVLEKKQPYYDHIKEVTLKDSSEINDIDFLAEVSQWINEGRLEVKVYTGDANYFHAKSYLFAKKQDAKQGFAIIGSSNFSANGLQGNTELNVLGQDVYGALSTWYKSLWESEEVEDFSHDLIEIVSDNVSKKGIKKLNLKSVRETYYDFASLYAKPYSTLDSNEEPWVKNLYPHQQTGVVDIKDKLDTFGTAVLSDGVGLGKTRTAAGIVKLYFETYQDFRVLFIADTKLKTQWQEELAIVGIQPTSYDYMSRDKFVKQSFNELNSIKYSLIVIDEAHQGFKNNNTMAYRRMRAFKERNPELKGLMLTATPWNNKRDDVLNIGMLFLNVDSIPNDREYKQYMILGSLSNKVIKQITTDDKAFNEFWTDIFLQRTRKTYGGKEVKFPTRSFPTVEINYEPQKDEIFSDNLETISSLKIPYSDPIKYVENNNESFTANQLKILLLKRADSSWKSYRESLKAIYNRTKELSDSLVRIQIERDDIVKRLKGIFYSHYQLVEYEYKNHILDGFDELENTDDQTLLRKKQYLNKIKAQIDKIKHGSKAKKIIRDMQADIDSDLEILDRLIDRLDNAYKIHDEKFETIRDNIKEELSLGRKVILISQFKTTANYYYEKLWNEFKYSENSINNEDSKVPMGLVVGGSEKEDKLGQISSTKKYILDCFSPKSKNAIELIGNDEIQLLVGTDSISTGQNLQDAVTLMNIDLPYNPMVLEQRIGRIDRPRYGEQEKNIYIYTFPAYSSIESQLGMTQRLGMKMEGILHDTQFDNVVLPEYQQYLANAKDKQNSAVETMLDKTSEKYRMKVGVSSEEHSEQYREANKRMYDFKIKGVQRTKEPILPISFSKGRSKSVGVVNVVYNDVNGKYINEEKLVVDLDNVEPIDISIGEENIYAEINQDYSFLGRLSENKARLKYEELLQNIQSLKRNLIEKQNEQMQRFKENSNNIKDNKAIQAAKELKNSAETNKDMILSIFKKNNMDPKQLYNIVRYIETISKEDELYPIVQEIAADVDKFWLNFKDYKEYFSDENLEIAMKIGSSVKTTNIRQANIDNTKLDLLFANICM